MNVPLDKPRLLIVSSALLVMAVSLLGNRAVPLYDGVGFPDEPYRYVVPPHPSVKTALPPSTATAVVPIEHGTNAMAGVSLTSDEQGPQFDLYTPSHTIFTDAQIATLQMQGVPQAPQSSDQPTDGQIAGNIYRLETNGIPATYRATNQKSIINLRLPKANTGTSQLSMEYRAIGKKWQRLRTAQVGNDIYQSSVTGFGDYALVVLATSQNPESAASPGAHTLNPLVAILGILVGLIAGSIALVRLAGRKAVPHDSKKRRAR